MNIGELRYRITLQKLKEITTDSDGFPLKDDDKYEDYKTVWSAVYPLKGNEFWSAMAVHTENTVKFIFRYIPNITTDMRVVYNNRKFNIIGAIDTDERHKWLQIMAMEVA